MPNIETPEEKMRKVEHPHVFAMRLVSKYLGLCQKVRGAAICERITIPTAMMDEIAARDAAIRSEQADLLRVCGEALQAAQSIKFLVQSIERGEDWEGGEPSLGTCRGFGRVKSISDEATTALIALREAGVL